MQRPITSTISCCIHAYKSPQKAAYNIKNSTGNWPGTFEATGIPRGFLDLLQLHFLQRHYPEYTRGLLSRLHLTLAESSLGVDTIRSILRSAHRISLHCVGARLWFHRPWRVRRLGTSRHKRTELHQLYQAIPPERSTPMRPTGRNPVRGRQHPSTH